MDGASDRFDDSLDFETAIDLESIEHQIAQLWHPDARGTDPITSLATRSAALNLIIYAPDDATADQMQHASERLSQVHPCRVILFSRATSRMSRSVSAEIYATCEADGDNSATPCIERIRIPVNRQMYQQLVTLVQPLIIPELPAYLWWPAKPSTSDSAFLALARSSNLTVIDSLELTSTDELTDLANLDAQLPSRTAICDLNWQRLQPWRELTAQFFDIRAVHWALGCVREVEIDAGQTNGNALPGQAVMFACWLAHCLDWAPVEARRTRNDRWYIGMRDKHGEDVRVIVRTRPSDDQWAGHLLSVSVSAQSHDGAKSSLSLSRSRGSSLIRMHARSGLDSALHHAQHHPLLPPEALLTRVLESPQRDHVFDSSLERAVEIMELFANPEAT